MRYNTVPFRKKFLLEFTQMDRGSLEKIEFNEYVRIFENGERICAL